MRYILGNVKKDGNLSIEDVLLIRSFLLGKITFTPEQLIIGDTNFDGTLTITDMLQIRGHLLGISLLNETVDVE